MMLVDENGRYAILFLCAPRFFAFIFYLLKIYNISFVEVFHTLSGRGRDSLHRAGPGLLVAFLTLPSKLGVFFIVTNYICFDFMQIHVIFTSIASFTLAY